MAGRLEDHVHMFRKKWEDCLGALEEETRQKTEVEAANEKLTTEIRTLKADYANLEKHTKNCEKATNKAQKEAKNAEGRANHHINSQKGQLKNAERRYEITARDLQEWRSKYGWSVDKPAEEKHDLQVRLSEWQSKAEKAYNEIAVLEGQIQGTPDQIGLHQALEQWEEHKGCSEEFAQLEDKLHDATERQQKLEADLAAGKQRYRKAESEMQVLQIRANQLEQANMAIQDQDKTNDYLRYIQQLESDLRISTERCQKMEEDMKAFLETVNQGGQEKTDFDMSDVDMLEKEKLESDLNAFQERQQQKESDMMALQEKYIQLEQDNQAFQDYIKDLLQKMESDQQASREQCQEKDSNMNALQAKANQLESDLSTTKAHYLTIKSSMEALEEKADQLELDLKVANEQHEITKSKMEEVQQEADRSEPNVEATEQYQTMQSNMEAIQYSLELDLESAREQCQTLDSSMERLQGEVDRLEEANQKYQKEEKERLQSEISKMEEQDKEGNKKIADLVQRHIGERNELLKQQNSSRYPEQDTKKEAERSQVTPPSSPVYTTDEGSQNLEKTPRPKVSLRQDLGFTSRDHSDEDVFDEVQSDVSIPQQQGAVLSKQAKTDEEKGDASAESLKNIFPEYAEEHAIASMRGGKKNIFSMGRKAKNLDTLQIRAKERAKEQSEVLESLFECTPAKANAIDRRLKALGPGCRLQEAPALVAYELSGIPEDTYKGLASGQLVATMPRNEVQDRGTSPETFADDKGTDTTGLPAEEVADPPLIARDEATDVTNVRVEGVSVSKKSYKIWDLFCLFLLLLLMIILGIFYLRGWLKGDPVLELSDGTIYRNVFSHRHTPFPTPSLNASTRVTLVYPPTPAPQLGLARMINGSSWGAGSVGRKW